MDTPDEKRIAAYRDPAWRARAWDEMQGRGGGLPLNFDSLAVAETTDAPGAHRTARSPRSRPSGAARRST